MPARDFFCNLPEAPDAAAEAVRARVGAPPGAFDLNRTLARFGDFTRLEVEDLESDGYLVPAGVLGPDYVVVLQAGANRNRQRFTAAHELGHLALTFNTQTLDDIQEERWCDRFGAALLMPRPDVEAFAARVTTVADWLTFGRAFNVSFRAAARRLWEVCRVALVTERADGPPDEPIYDDIRDELLVLNRKASAPGDYKGALACGADYIIRRAQNGGSVCAAQMPRKLGDTV